MPGYVENKAGDAEALRLDEIALSARAFRSMHPARVKIFAKADRARASHRDKGIARSRHWLLCLDR